MKATSVIFTLCALPLAAFGFQKRGTPTSFNIYAYGDKFGGIPLFYANGYAYVGDVAKSNETDAAIVSFSTRPNNIWTASANTTSSSTPIPSWSNSTFFVPGVDATDKRVGFLPSNDTSTDNKITSGFRSYGHTIALVGSDASLQTLWYSLQVGDGIHALYWNDTSLGQVPVILRNLAPSNPAPGAKPSGDPGVH